MSAKDAQTHTDLRKVKDILEQRMYEIECSDETSYRYLESILDVVNDLMAKLE